MIVSSYYLLTPNGFGRGRGATPLVIDMGKFGYFDLTKSYVGSPDRRFFIIIITIIVIATKSKPPSIILTIKLTSVFSSGGFTGIG